MVELCTGMNLPIACYQRKFELLFLNSRTSTIDDPTGGGTGHGGTGSSEHAVVEDDYDSDYGEEDFEDGENDGKF